VLDCRGEAGASLMRFRMEPRGIAMLTTREREMLLLAQARIARHEDDFICVALMDIERVWFNHAEEAIQASTRLRDYIRESLDGCETLDEWQRRHGIWRSHVTCRQDRLDWIDWMLKGE